jgi:Tol biopolymer transport system component
VVFVRPSDTHGFEDMILYDLPKHEERLLLHWPGSIWSMAWDPSGSHLAFVADKGSGYERNTSLYLLDAASGHVDDLTPGTGWVSAYFNPELVTVGGPDRV